MKGDGDLSPLTNLDKLRKIKLTHCLCVKDLNPLCSLKKLEYLIIRGMNIDIPQKLKDKVIKI